MGTANGFTASEPSEGGGLLRARNPGNHPNLKGLDASALHPQPKRQLNERLGLPPWPSRLLVPERGMLL